MEPPAQALCKALQGPEGSQSSGLPARCSAACASARSSATSAQEKTRNVHVLRVYPESCWQKGTARISAQAAFATCPPKASEEGECMECSDRCAPSCCPGAERPFMHRMRYCQFAHTFVATGLAKRLDRMPSREPTKIPQLRSPGIHIFLRHKGHWVLADTPATFGLGDKQISKLMQKVENKSTWQSALAHPLRNGRCMPAEHGLFKMVRFLGASESKSFKIPKSQGRHP